LNEQKKALVLESELNRMLLRAEAENIRKATAQFDLALKNARQFSSWIVPALSVAGLVAGRSLGGQRRGALRLLRPVLSLATTVWMLWRRKKPDAVE
jgi:hypothetical protein